MPFSAFPQKEIVRLWCNPKPNSLGPFLKYKIKALPPNMKERVSKNKQNKKGRFLNEGVFSRGFANTKNSLTLSK